jgi:two-component system, chemotaxis family, sensor kinase CheA
MDDLLQEFLTETGEHLDTVDLELVRFEQDPNNQAILRNIFRLVHTIKGTCGFLGLPRLEALAHAAETVMGHFRDGSPVTTEAVTLILATIDRIKAILAELAQSAAEPEGHDNDLIQALRDLAMSIEPVSHDPEITFGQLTYQVLERKLAIDEVDLDELERVFRETEGPVLADMSGKPEMSATGLPNATGLGGDEAARDPKIATVQTLRVNVDTLEHLMTMVSELVLTRNQLLEIARRQDDAGYKVPLQRLSHITAELQDGVMKTRMQPIGTAWSKLPRIIRDLSHELNKKIELVMDGSETELDRQILDLIKDPLTHMVRNSADHAIETPAERRALGKAEHGTVKLSAFHEGGSITIVVADDGRGLNIPKIRQKALQNRLISEADLERMPDAQVARFIFHPGFSTAANITAVSGRGVGMDVVKSNIDAIGGTVDIATVAGEGTTMTVKIPLTLAIVAALIVSAHDQRFAIPQIAVRELVRVKADSEHQIEFINGAPVLRLRDRLLPVVALSRLMALRDGPTQADGFIVVTQVGSRQFGIMVDGVFHTEEIVVKPMSVKLRALPVFSGNTILGDGAVVLIVDPNGISRMVGAIDGEREDKLQTAQVSTAGANETVTMLIFKGGGDGYKAIPLSVVTRLEEIEASSIEMSSGRALLQYRGRLMPIVPSARDVEIRRDGAQSMIIFSDGDRAMGLAVDSIIDIVEDRLDIEMASTSELGVIGSAVIRGRATEIVDIAHFLPMAYPDWLSGNRRPQSETAQQHVLLVDPSPFFRDMLGPVLKAAGYRVVMAANAAEASEALARNAQIVAAIVDVETAPEDAFAFIGQIRADNHHAGLPIVALAAFATAALAQQAHAAGIHDVIAKFDRRALVAALAALVPALKEAA